MVILELPWRGSDRVQMWLEVYPDDYYDHEAYDQLLSGFPPESIPACLISEADARAKASRH